MDGFCCQVPSEPRCSLCGYSKCLVIIGICEFGPITVVPCRAKIAPLPRASILYRPRRLGARSGALEFGGGAGYCPRVRKGFSDGDYERSLCFDIRPMIAHKQANFGLSRIA